MGSGKRNYRAMRFSSRVYKKKSSSVKEEEKKEPNKEDVDRLVALFQKKKE